jgi:site-specific recombinase XerD
MVVEANNLCSATWAVKDGVEYYLNVTEKRNKKRRNILLDAARAVLSYGERAGINKDVDGPFYRPLRPAGLAFLQRHLDRKTPWRLVKEYWRAVGIEPGWLGCRGIRIRSLRKAAINVTIRNGAHMPEVQESAGHSDIRTTKLYFVCREKDGQVAARRIQILPMNRMTR